MSAQARHQRVDGDVAQPAVVDERQHRRRRGDVVRGQRRFQIDPHVLRSALHGPVLPRQHECRRRVVHHVQHVRRLLAHEDMVAALVHGLEARVHLAHVRRRGGGRQRRFGSHPDQKRRVGGGVGADQVQRLPGAALVEQKRAISGEKEIVARRPLQGLAEVSLGNVGLAEALGAVGEQTLQPGLDRVARLRPRVFDHRQQRIRLRGMAGHRSQRGAADQARETAVDIGQLHAGAIRLGQIALHHRHRRQREPGLRVAGITLQDRRQLRARVGEQVAALLDGGVRHQHRHRRRRCRHEGLDDRHRAAQVARVAGGSRVVDVGIGQRDGLVDGVRRLLSVAAQAVETAHARIGRRRHPLQHDAGADRHVGFDSAGVGVADQAQQRDNP